MKKEWLSGELGDLEGIMYQDPETGKRTIMRYTDKYTNRLFGAPFQLLDSVDKRFVGVNENVGSEYLRNFILNAPILRIRPGMPKYTGGDTDGEGLWNMVKGLYFSSNTSELSGVQGLLQLIGKTTIFSAGSRLQRRMFGFRETYYDYMQYVNYMCRSCATFLYLTNGDKFPDGAFPSGSTTMESFSKFKWENYRMMDNAKTSSPLNYLSQLFGHAADPLLKDVIGEHDTNEVVDGWLNSRMGMSSSNVLDIYDLTDQIDFVNMTERGGVTGVIGQKTTCVEFMVEPQAVTESLSNKTGSSLVEQGIDALRESIGSEIGWITNSHADTGMIGGMMEFLGSGLETATTAVAGMAEGLTGGFVGGLFSGAVASVKGQKMIYPEIYKSSDSKMNTNFEIILSSPYGDVYNYYMNIIVPLMHLIALAAPRMVTANTVSSPYIVQAYIPGTYTCQLGIISEMNITKNPNGNRVSVNGFPLEVKVTFTIKELYNALSISPANDPASFLFNETLNDYMANLSGLIPSIDTYTKQREATFYALEEYIKNGWTEDIASVVGEKFENWANPFANR